MEKIILFKDILGNVSEIKTSIDLLKQLKNEPFWIVASRKVFPQETDWQNYPLENLHFKTEEEAWKAIKVYISKYEKNCEKIGLKKGIDFYYEETSLEAVSITLFLSYIYGESEDDE